MFIDNGIYTIRNAKAQTSFLTMDKSLAQQQPTYVFGYPWCGLDTQRWWMQQRHDSPTYNIQNVETKKYLTIDGRPWNDRTVCGKTSASNWYIAAGDGNHVRLYIQNTGFNMDLTGHGDPAPGTRVAIWGDNMKNLDHCWILERVHPVSQPIPLRSVSINSGVYLLVNVYNNKVMDLSGNDNKSVSTFPLHGGPNQQWRIEHLGEGYSIRSISSGKYLTSEECVCDGAAVVANGFPVSWNLSSALDSSDIYIHWPSQQFQVAVALIMPPAGEDTNPVSQ
ncbi:hypothetical protein BC629DRAFT_1505456 [Irpex lacteus]|nr:hypothetical protein BC629DRAFT_1505456 [Irpex lacteus]